MFQQIALGIVLVLVTTTIHALATKLMYDMTRQSDIGQWKVSHPWFALVLVSAIVLMMFLATLVEAGLWAGVYVVTGAFSSIEPALYFSIVTYTTLGYGDVVVGPEWRLMASVQAANGVIMFGWTTGILVYAIQRIHEHARRRASDS